MRRVSRLPLAMFGVVALAVVGARPSCGRGSGIRTLCWPGRWPPRRALVDCAGRPRRRSRAAGSGDERRSTCGCACCVQVVPLLLGRSGSLARFGAGTARLGRSAAAGRCSSSSRAQRTHRGGGESTRRYPVARVLSASCRASTRFPRGAPVRDRRALRWTLRSRTSSAHLRPGGRAGLRGHAVRTARPDTFGLWCVPHGVLSTTGSRMPASAVSGVSQRPLRADAARLRGGRPAGRSSRRTRGGRAPREPSDAAARFRPATRRLDRPEGASTLHLEVMRDDPGLRQRRRGRAGAGRRAAPGRIANGPAEVRIASYAAERHERSRSTRQPRHARRHVDPEMAGLEADDRRQAPLPRFPSTSVLAFEAPAGRHRGAAAYLPDGFRLRRGASRWRRSALAVALGAAARRGCMTASATSIATGEKTRAADQEIHCEGSSARWM